MTKLYKIMSGECILLSGLAEANLLDGSCTIPGRALCDGAQSRRFDDVDLEGCEKVCQETEALYDAYD